MNTLRTIICSLLLASTSMVLAQGGALGGKDVKPISPELLAKLELANDAIDRGKAFLKDDQLDEAIAAFREVVGIYENTGLFFSRGNYELAKALTLAGHTEDALAAYKNAVQWYPRWKDLQVTGPPTIRVLMDYAILLARSGKEEEAKAVYYSGLRRYNPGSSFTIEPFPFLVVFEPDPTMTVWCYSPEKLITAAKMAKAPFLETNKTIALVDEVLLMEPDWIIPVTYRASRRTGQWRQNYLDQAMLLATNDDEREWIRTMNFDREPTEIGNRIRKASTVLNTAKRELERNHHRIAVCECEGGH